MYIWEQPGWPAFRWDDARILEPLASTRLIQGRLLGRMAALGISPRQDTQLEALTDNIVMSSAIEGEVLDRERVRSSVARRLGVEVAGLTPADRRTEGVVEMMLDATERFDQRLTVERLFAWQTALFPKGRGNLSRIRTGAWRDDAHGRLQVVSGAFGRERVHYEAPPASVVDVEMGRFLDWFNDTRTMDGVLRAAVAHVWFVTIHPFDDGNGRIARAIADQALAQSEDSRERYYSMSSQIRRERADYYAILERTQKGDLDITPWLLWFLGCLSRAIAGAGDTYSHVLHKAEFWQRHADEPLTSRQRAVINRYLDGFEGKLTARKWATIGKCSIPTAQRDINDLIERGIVRRNPGGSRSTTYALIVQQLMSMSPG